MEDVAPLLAHFFFFFNDPAPPEISPLPLHPPFPFCDMILTPPLPGAPSAAAAVPAVPWKLLLMWRPVRLQGVGAPASVIDGNPHPAGKLDAWRRQVNCLFGLALNGQPFPTASGRDNPFFPDRIYSCPSPSSTTHLKTPAA